MTILGHKTRTLLAVLTVLLYAALAPLGRAMLCGMASDACCQAGTDAGEGNNDDCCGGGDPEPVDSCDCVLDSAPLIPQPPKWDVPDRVGAVLTTPEIAARGLFIAPSSAAALPVVPRCRSGPSLHVHHCVFLI